MYCREKKTGPAGFINCANYYWQWEEVRSGVGRYRTLGTQRGKKGRGTNIAELGETSLGIPP